jgi:hypothetical protein
VFNMLRQSSTNILQSLILPDHGIRTWLRDELGSGMNYAGSLTLMHEGGKTHNLDDSRVTDLARWRQLVSVLNYLGTVQSGSTPQCTMYKPKCLATR